MSDEGLSIFDDEPEELRDPDDDEATQVDPR